MKKPNADFFESTMYDLHCQQTGRHKAKLARQKWFYDICDRTMLDLVEKQRQTLPDNECVLKTASEYELQYYKNLQETVSIADLHCNLTNDIKKEDKK